MRIGIVNAWGANRGDEAMLSALLCHLRDVSPAAQITIYNNAALDLDRFNVSYRDWIGTKDAWPGVSRWRRHMRAAMLMTRAPWKPSIPSTLLDHDLILSAPSGPAFGELYRHAEWRQLLPLAIAQATGTPHAILATSAGPFTDSWRNAVRQRCMRHLSFWSVRERISQEHLRALKLRSPVHVGADLVFAHPDRPPEQYTPTPQQSAFAKVVDSFERDATIIVTLNRTQYVDTTGRVTPFNADRYIASMSSLLRHVVDETGCRVMIFPHFCGHHAETRLINRVIETTDRHDATDVLDASFNAEMQMHLYHKAIFAISHRYHPTIFAARANCPFMCIRHQFKTDGMLGMFNNPGPKVTTLDDERWIEAFDEAWATRRVIAAQLRRHLPDTITQANVHLRCLDDLIGRQPASIRSPANSLPQQKAA